MAEEKETDWLFPDAGKDRAAGEEKGLIFAQRYLVFSGKTADPRARELLEYWTSLARTRKLAPNSTVQEYAAANAFREFVEGIHMQIDFANRGTSVPKPRTSP